MALLRRNRGFARAGSVAPERLGLSAARSRELRLATAWRAVAGAPLAARARAVAVRRGVLEVQVEEARWGDALAPLLPRLAARMAERLPKLGIRRWRLDVLSGDVPARSGEAAPDEPAAKADAATRRATPVAAGAAAAPRPARSAGELDQRVRRLAERYLRRVEQPDQKP